MHKQFVKMLYVFWGTCIFMTVIGYGSEILHDRIVKTDNTKELASLKADHSTLNEKYEKLNKDFVSLQLDNVKYKTMVELISKETSRPIAAVAGAKAFTGLPPIPVTGKMEDYKESPYKEPTCSDKPTSADEIYKANVKRILAGQSPISDDEILKQDAKNLKEWDDYRSNLSNWLGKNPGQIKYYDANLRLKPLDGGDAPPANEIP